MVGNVLILGINGGFGSLFSRHLCAHGLSVAGIDVAAQPAQPRRCHHYVSGDLRRPTEAMLAAAHDADCLLLCLPEQASLSALTDFPPAMRAGSLIVDTLSVKTPVAEKVAAITRPFQVLSLNPLFAPDLGFRGNGVLAVALSPGSRAEAFLGLLRTWGAHVTLMTADEHDRQTAITQAATHAAILAFGMCLGALGYDAAAALPAATPPHRTLLALVARILRNNPDVYWNIQVDNPHAARARQALIERLRRLEQYTAANDRAAFLEALNTTAETLSPILEELTAHAARIFEQGVNRDVKRES